MSSLGEKVYGLKFDRFLNNLSFSLGVDTHEGDPISDFRLTTDGYKNIGEIIAKINKPTLFVMEG